MQRMVFERGEEGSCRRVLYWAMSGADLVARLGAGGLIEFPARVAKTNLLAISAFKFPFFGLKKSP